MKGEACTYAHGEHELAVAGNGLAGTGKGVTARIGNVAIGKGGQMGIGMGGAAAAPIGMGGQMAIGMGGAAAAPGAMTRLCKFFESGHCHHGRACTYAHGWQELNGGEKGKGFSPGIGMKGGMGFSPLGGEKGKSKGKGGIKTKLCNFFLAGTCPRSGEECSFAHGEEELQPGRRKTRLCQFFEGGACSKGEDCSFAHGEHELQTFDAGLDEAQQGIEGFEGTGGIEGMGDVFDEVVEENLFDTFEEASIEL